jgi:hypothetical protein
MHSGREDDDDMAVVAVEFQAADDAMTVVVVTAIVGCNARL